MIAKNETSYKTEELKKKMWKYCKEQKKGHRKLREKSCIEAQNLKDV